VLPGNTFGSSAAPLVGAVGSDRVIFSKKLLFIIGARAKP
jgi:hypothetical protein